MPRSAKFFKIALAVMFLLTCAACKQDLYTGLSEQEANEMVSVLFRAGIDAERLKDKDGTVSVRVHQDRFHDAVERLKEQGYPKQSFKTLGDVFEGNGFVVSQMEERARFIYALSEELSRTIADIDGVLSARTHVVLPTSDPMSRDITPSSASVVIRHLTDSQTETLLPQIKMLVANSIQGLAYENVSVVFIPVANPVFEPQPPLPSSMFATYVQNARASLWIIGGLICLIIILTLLLVRRHFLVSSEKSGGIDIAPAE